MNLTYDGFGRVATVTDGNGNTLTYTYDADGNMLTAKDGAGTGTYGYNTLDQLTSLTDPTGAYWQFSYNAACTPRRAARRPCSPTRRQTSTFNLCSGVPAIHDQHVPPARRRLERPLGQGWHGSWAVCPPNGGAAKAQG